MKTIKLCACMENAHSSTSYMLLEAAAGCHENALWGSAFGFKITCRQTFVPGSASSLFESLFAYAKICITLYPRPVSQRVNAQVNHKSHFIILVNYLFFPLLLSPHLPTTLLWAGGGGRHANACAGSHTQSSILAENTPSHTLTQSLMVTKGNHAWIQALFSGKSGMLGCVKGCEIDAVADVEGWHLSDVAVRDTKREAAWEEESRCGLQWFCVLHWCPKAVAPMICEV